MEEVDTPSILTDLGPLNGLPGDCRYVPAYGKIPYDKKESQWNRNPSLWMTAHKIFQERSLGRVPNIGLMTGSRVGNYVWLDFDGIDKNEKTGEIISAQNTLSELSAKGGNRLSIEDLLRFYKSPVNESGKVNRCRILYRMPFKYIEALKNKSFNQSKLEIIWEKGAGSQCHGLIEGKHPDGSEKGKPLYYRWKEGYSPVDVEIRELPEEIIKGWLKTIEEIDERKSQVTELKTEGKFFDLLSPGEQRRLIKDMSKYWPIRKKKRNVYQIMRRLVLSLWRGIGDKETFELWLVNSSWDRKNDWAGIEDKADRVNGGTLISFAESLDSSISTEEVKPWGAAWSLAEEGGWVLPAWAKNVLPPKAIAEDFLSKSVKKSL